MRQLEICETEAARTIANDGNYQKLLYDIKNFIVKRERISFNCEEEIVVKFCIEIFSEHVLVYDAQIEQYHIFRP